MNIYLGVKGLKLSLMDGEKVIAEIADIDSASAIVGKLMSACTADAQW